MELIEGVTKPYHWGRTDFIPEWLGHATDGRPRAELWFGAHPAGPSTVVATGQTLEHLVAEQPGVVRPGDEHFPFLAKILAAGSPLSIQVHPDSAQARAGFLRENDAGIPLDAPNRTYRDRSAKPELVCAVTPFTAKCGFAVLDRTRRLLAHLDCVPLRPVEALLAGGGTDSERVWSAVRHLFRLDTDEASRLAASVVAAARELATSGPTAAEGQDEVGFADELAWTTRLATVYPDDIGIVVALFLNHVVLQPGEALFLGAGNMHSYLDGVAIEVMAPSDNVVRGGLTSKHIDIEELLSVVDTTPISPRVQVPSGTAHEYDVDDDTFGLTRIELDAGDASIGVSGPGILIVTDADLEVTAADRRLSLTTGQSLLVRADDGEVHIGGAGLAHFANAPDTAGSTAA